MSRKCVFPRLAGIAAFALLVGTFTLRAQEVPWPTDYAAARRLAKEKNRPLIIDFNTTDCLWCRKLEATTFRDAAVLQLLRERFVVVQVDGEKDTALAKALDIHSYPTLVFAKADGTILGMHEGYVDAQRFVQQLQHTLTKAGPVPPVSDDRARQARALLALARDDFRAQRFASCLERCRELIAGYTELVEGTEAKQLIAAIKSDPERLRKACACLADSLGEMYLELADQRLRTGQAEQAAACWQRVVQTCPGTRQAQVAEERLEQFRNSVAPPPNHVDPVVRGQAP